MSKPETFVDKYRLDKLGVFTSLACAIHCAAPQMLIGFAPLIGFSLFMREKLEWVEWGFTLLSIGIGALSFLPSFARIHRQFRPLFLFSSGGGIIIAVRLLQVEDSPIETSAMIFGALLITCAHYLNHRLCKNCSSCHPNKT